MAARPKVVAKVESNRITGLEGLVLSVLKSGGQWFWVPLEEKVNQLTEYGTAEGQIIVVVNNLIYRRLVRVSVRKGEFLVLEAESTNVA